MVCGIYKTINPSLHDFYSDYGFDVIYKEVDELVLFEKFCGKNFKLEETAWNYAEYIVQRYSDNCLVAYVVYSYNKKPVKNYKSRAIYNIPTFK